MTAFVQLALDWLGGPSIQEEPLPLPASNAAKAFSASFFVHPLASRQIQLQQTTVAYAFQRVKRKTIGMSVGADGLEVRAPRWATVASVEAVLHEKSDWILRKLAQNPIAFFMQHRFHACHCGPARRTYLQTISAYRHANGFAFDTLKCISDGGLLQLNLSAGQWVYKEGSTECFGSIRRRER